MARRLETAYKDAYLIQKDQRSKVKRNELKRKFNFPLFNQPENTILLPSNHKFNFDLA